MRVVGDAQGQNPTQVVSLVNLSYVEVSELSYVLRIRFTLWGNGECCQVQRRGKSKCCTPFGYIAISQDRLTNNYDI